MNASKLADYVGVPRSTMDLEVGDQHGTVLDKALAASMNEAQNGFGGFRVNVRRVVASTSFDRIYDSAAMALPVTGQHALRALVPRGKQRMVTPRGIQLIDRNGERRECIGEAFHTGHQTLVLLHDTGLINTMVIVPDMREFRATLSKIAKRS